MNYEEDEIKIRTSKQFGNLFGTELGSIIEVCDISGDYKIDKLTDIIDVKDD